MTPREQITQADVLPLLSDSSDDEVDALELQEADLQRLEWYMANGFHEEQFAELSTLCHLGTSAVTLTPCTLQTN